jgi:hypothetical protein
MTEGLILWKEKKQIRKIYINSEDTIDPKVSALYKQKRTPDGRKLEMCVFHSCYNDKLPTDSKEINRVYDYCVDGIEDFCYCTNDFKVYDLCHITEEKMKKQDQETQNKMYNKIHNYDHNMEVTYKFHDNFMVIFEERKKFIQRKTELEKKFGNFKDDFSDNPEYSTLLQLLYRAEETLENKKKNIEKIYDLKPQKVSKEDFVSIHSKEELDLKNKAKHNLEHWYNKNNNNNTNREKEELFRLELGIQNITKLLNNSYEIPCVYIYKAISALNDLYTFFNKDSSKVQLITKIHRDLEKCKDEFRVYKEFIGTKNIEDIMKKVEEEQLKVAEEEKRNKQRSQTIQKLKTSQQSFVVKIDGTVSEDTNEGPKLIIGSKDVIEDDKWKSFR